MSARVLSVLFLLLPLAGCLATPAAEGDPAIDLGLFAAAGKADDETLEARSLDLDVPAASGEAPGRVEYTVRTLGKLRVRSELTGVRDRAQDRLQVSVESRRYRRRSFRGTDPFLTMAAPESGTGELEYRITVLNFGAVAAHGKLHLAPVFDAGPGVRMVHNQPDCDDGCTEKAGELRSLFVDALQSAEHSIELAIYGIDDAAIRDALCNAVEAGVRVRMVVDGDSEEPGNPRGYYEPVFGPNGLVACGVDVQPVRTYAIMHHKFAIIDRGTPGAFLVTGSTNFTKADFERNHNHGMLLRGMPALYDAYAEEFGQLHRHCASGRQDGKTEGCDECSPGCIEDRHEEGPWAYEGGSASLYFSPVDDAMHVLRGKSREVRRASPDPACVGPDAECLCRKSGGGWACEYCAQDERGFGLIGTAERRIAASVFSFTDSCLALGMVRAARRGVETVTVWDRVMGAGQGSRDEYLCAEGVSTTIARWSGGNAQVRNHNKTVIVDDTIFDGSMNLSASGADKNNENTLVFEDGALADAFVAYIHAEAALAVRLGSPARTAAECRCADLIDNDGDGVADADDGDCDAGGT